MYYFLQVLQTGFSFLEWLSLFNGFVQIPMVLLRAGWTWYKRHLNSKQVAALDGDDDPLALPLADPELLDQPLVVNF
jgi:hypothetical protein